MYFLSGGHLSRPAEDVSFTERSRVSVSQISVAGAGRSGPVIQ